MARAWVSSAVGLRGTSQGGPSSSTPLLLLLVLCAVGVSEGSHGGNEVRGAATAGYNIGSAPRFEGSSHERSHHKQQRSIEAVPDKSLTTTGQETGCEHYRHGYLGIALCANYYDSVKDGVPYVQVIGSITNEGVVDICNLTLSIDRLSEATVVTPDWVPNYPRSSSFKASTYFPFSVVIPVTPESAEGDGSYPAVDIYRSFYACDSSLHPLPEDQVVPPPGVNLPANADDEGEGSGSGNKRASGSSNTFGTKIKWAEFIKAAGASKDCINTCVGTLNEATDDCTAVAYVIQSGCAARCPEALPSWAKSSCKSAGCSADQCHPKATSPAAPRSSTTFSMILLTAIYTAFFAIKAFL